MKINEDALVEAYTALMKYETEGVYAPHASNYALALGFTEEDALKVKTFEQLVGLFKIEAYSSKGSCQYDYLLEHPDKVAEASVMVCPPNEYDYYW